MGKPQFMVGAMLAIAAAGRTVTAKVIEVTEEPAPKIYTGVALGGHKVEGQVTTYFQNEALLRAFTGVDRSAYWFTRLQSVQAKRMRMNMNRILQASGLPYKLHSWMQ